MTGLEGFTILIVEDDDFSMEMLKRMVLDTGAAVLQAEDGEKAVEIFKNNRIDLVLLDIRIPKMNGIEVMIEMKKIRPYIPVIAQSAFAFNNEKERCISMGFSDYLTKPISQNILSRVLLNYLVKE